MTNNFQPLLTAAAALGPLLLLGLGSLPAAFLNRHALPAARAAARVALAAFGFSLLALACLVAGGKADGHWLLAGPFTLGVHVDNLTIILLVLVSFLLAVVTRYSINYLAGDPGQGRFTKWLCLTGGCVLVIVISGNLLQFALAWSATSWCLHQLLMFYPGRPGAVLAARKKFIISRLGDLCLLIVLVLVFKKFHTWEFSAIFAACQALHASDLAAGWFGINAICFLLVAGAMMKSAQFPFHSWLPDTMETPTPVSALMHAGIINAGGYLIIRLSPLVTLSAAAMSTLALFGAFTALFASLVMLTHASVKRSLAFSTVAQMGFMMLECGLGAFGLATLHIVAHSLYKAHAFLASGSLPTLVKSAWLPPDQQKSRAGTLAAALGMAVLLGLAGDWLFHLDARHAPAGFVLECTFVMALAYSLWNLWSQSVSLTGALLGALVAGGIAAAYFALHTLFDQLITANPWDNQQLNSLPGRVVIIILLALFFGVLVIQTELPRWTSRPFFQALYVHARNGFYFTTLANRAVAALWPVKMPPAKS